MFFLSNILIFSKEIQQKEKDLNALEKNCIEMQQNYSREIEMLKRENQLEVQDLEFELLKTMTELQSEKENAAKNLQELELKFVQEREKIKAIFDMEKSNILMQTEQQIKEVYIFDI